MDRTIKLGISSCLLGQAVRYDGGHKLNRFLTDTLGRYVEYVPVCPEVECGFGVPRETLHLSGDPQAPRLVTTRTGKDHTRRMQTYAKRRVKELEQADLCGFVFKGGSPSSGMMRVKVYNKKGMPVKKGTGIFARAFMDHFPLIPTEEDGRLHDPKIRENFIERIFTLRRWREALQKTKTLGGLVEFHTRHKLLILSHSEKHYRAMGKLVAAGREYTKKEVLARYEEHLMEALKLQTTTKKNVNVLQHMMGYFKKHLSADEKQELLDIIQTYHRGQIPIIVPVTIFNHYVRKYGQPYLRQQVYLNPHPLALKLRNHA